MPNDDPLICYVHYSAMNPETKNQRDSGESKKKETETVIIHNLVASGKQQVASGKWQEMVVGEEVKNPSGS